MLHVNLYLKNARKKYSFAMPSIIGCKLLEDGEQVFIHLYIPSI